MNYSNLDPNTTSTDDTFLTAAPNGKSSDDFLSGKHCKRGLPKKLFFIVPVMIALVLLTAGWLMLKQSKPTPNQKNSAPTAFEKRLNNEQRSQLHAFSMPIYIPKDLPVEKAVIGTNRLLGLEFLAFGSNSQYGQGVTKGSYGFTEFTLTKSFNPPTDCGLPAGGSAASAISCVAYDQAEANMPAYIIEGLQPGTVISTSNRGLKPITMYVKRGSEVITVQTIGESPAVLYRTITNMSHLQPADLPGDSSVSFY